MFLNGESDLVLSYTTSPACGEVRKEVAEEVVGDDHVELLGPAGELHGAGVGVHVGQFHVRVLGVVVMTKIHHCRSVIAHLKKVSPRF